VSTIEHTTPTGADTTRTLVGDVAFEAAFIATGTVRVAVVAGSEAEAHASARAQVRGVVGPAWELLTLSLARALRDELEGAVRSMRIARQLEDEEMELLVIVEPRETD
jgi:hypothetical protein